MLPVGGTPRENEGFKVRERGRHATREDCSAYRGGSPFHREGPIQAYQ